MATDASDSHIARLVGREHDLARLRRLVADPPPGALIMITGEAGIGKTSLVNQVVAERLAAGERLVLRGAGDERVTARFSMWRRVLRELGVELPHADPMVGAADQVEELAATIGDSLAAGASQTIVFEDAHWADASSVDVLQLVLDRLISCPVAILATARPGEPRAPTLTRLQHQSQSIALGGLTPADIESLAVALTGETLTSDAAADLYRRTGGNPLFVRELLAASRPRLSVTTGGLLTDALTALGPVTADVLGAIAIAGRSAPWAASAYALSIPLDELELHQRRGLETDILTSGADGVWFRHDLLADAAANRFDPGSRRALHRSLAEYWAAFPDLDDDGLERARHTIASAASIPAVEDTDVVLETSAYLRRQRRAGDAADLLQRALDAWPAAPPPLSTRLWMALGEARWELAERRAAVECFDRAAETARDVDVVTAVAIEVARQRNHNPFVPDPAARQRLFDLDQQLPGADSAVRAALLGRRALLALQPPARRREASELADAAVAMARRLGDPDAVLTALCDRAFVISSAEDLRGRTYIAEEVLELARTSGHPDRAIAGYEWRFDDLLTRGDLTGAARALDEFEALAYVAPSPFWRYTSSLRRAMLLLVQGDRDGSIDAIAATAPASSGVIDPFELIGLELGIRAPAMIMFGQSDRRLIELHTQMVEMFDHLPSSFMQVRLAMGDLLVGNRASSLQRARRWLVDPSTAFEAPDPLGTLALMALLASELQVPKLAPRIADALNEFTGLLAGAIPMPVDLLLAQLAMVIGDGSDAIAHTQGALVLARSMPAPVIEAHCLRTLGEAQLAVGDPAAAAAATAAAVATAERNGAVLTPPWSRHAAVSDATANIVAAAEQLSTRQARLERDGDIWRLRLGAESATLAHITGLEQLARLLQVPDVEIRAAHLNGTPEAPAEDFGPALDARAKREYRQRINELRAEIDEAERWADPDRAETARHELDALISELRRAIGLSGRDRPQGSGSERARINVARNIRRAIAAIDRVAPELAAHLAVSIRTGHQCTYAPEPAARITWEISLGR
jgi:hypothetical protein